MAKDDKRNRESGNPGGGKGRSDDVGRSGIYPAGGPPPPRDAEIRTPGSFGQGERGGAGYEDHGSSEMTFTGGQVLGAISGQPSGEPARPVGGEVGREVPRERWREFLDAFSRNHNGWMINIEVLDRAEGPHIEVEDRAFEGISADDAAGEHTISVFSGRTLGEHLAHLISRPRRLHLLRADELEIEDEDGNITRVRLRSREQRAA